MSTSVSQTDATNGNDTAQPVKTEQQMRDMESPRPKSLEELTAYIKGLADQQHDYGTCVYAMSLAATAAYNFIGSHLGMTGFQASAASIDLIKRIRHVDGPFIILEIADELYGDGTCQQKLSEYIGECRMRLRKMARHKLEKGGYFHPSTFRTLADFATRVPMNDGEVKEWNSANPDDQIIGIGNEWYERNQADFLAYCEKLQFLKDMGGYFPSEQFAEIRAADFKRFGFESVHLHDGDVSKADGCKEGASFRLSMPVSLEFTRNIDGLKVNWSVNTEVAGSDGTSKHNFDFGILEALAEGAKPAVREAIEAYILKARAAQQAV